MIKKDQIIDAVLEGIVESNSFYERLSNGLWLTDSAVESIMQTKIAESIFRIIPKNEDGFPTDESIVMEYQIRDIIDNSGSKKLRGKVPQLINGAKRVDLTIFNRDRAPIIPIEIKRNATADGFAIDAERVLGILKRSDTSAGGTVKFGLICGFIFGNGEQEHDAVDERDRKVEQSRSKVEAQIPDQNFEFRYRMDDPIDFGENGWWAGGAICVYLRRNSAR